MGVMLRVSLRQMAGRRRLALLVLLAALPVGLAVLLKTFLSDDSDFADDFINTIIDGMIISAIMPLVVMALSTAAFGNEVEDRTLNFLVLKPVSRVSIVIPKLIGSIAFAAPLIVASGVAVTLIALGDGGGRAALATGGALLVGVITPTLRSVHVGRTGQHESVGDSSRLRLPVGAPARLAAERHPIPEHPEATRSASSTDSTTRRSHLSRAV